MLTYPVSKWFYGQPYLSFPLIAIIFHKLVSLALRMRQG